MSSSSPVGGVRLGGAGRALEGLGQLRGIAVDEATGKLVLIGSDEQQIDLPPLRLDDVVTVFRAVYNHGQSPSVTIDPDEQDPKGPIMLVKHGPGTEGTYVGWVLFECDRIMKTYMLGEDNNSGDTLSSRISGYPDTLDAVFFGNPKRRGPKPSAWERFWIVPSTVRRFDAGTTDLSLFELPLKVNTQSMHWVGGHLVDDPKAKSSFGAKAFKTWFSEHYDDIADEVLLPPPPGYGFDEPVPIFHELRRIALITGIAERLRDLGQTMPLWMRDYRVAFFPVSETTPSLTVDKEKKVGSGTSTANIYGGVNLAPADKDLHVYSGAGAANGSIPEADVAFVDLSRREAAVLVSRIPELARADEPVGTITPVMMPDGRTLLTTLLPGSDTRALAPNRQQVTDLSVPIGLGRSIELTRHYNSFFDPAGALGRGWTLDLPELRNNPVPVSRDGKHSQYRGVPHLLSPLARVDVRFDGTEIVQPYGFEMQVPADHPEIVGISGGTSKIPGADTTRVLFRDGGSWDFDDEGRLVLVSQDGSATRYVWDSAGPVGRIMGYVGEQPVAEIALTYDGEHRVIQAVATQAEHLRVQAPAAWTDVRFEYGDDGRLARVTSAAVEGEPPASEWLYAYEGGLLSRIGGFDLTELEFGYDARGQLLWEQLGEERQHYDVAATSSGTQLTLGGEDAAGDSTTWSYDAQMRPVEAKLGDGRTTTWQYGEDDEVRETVLHDGKPVLTRSTSRDGLTETTAFTDGPTYELRRDASGNPTTISRDGAVSAELSWQPDGTLAKLRLGGTEMQPRRHPEGWQNGVLISAPSEDGKITQWLEEETDVMGRPTRVSDSSGFEYAMEYDDQGRLRAFGLPTEGGGISGTALVYGDDGLVTGIDSAWGSERRDYGADGLLARVEFEREGVKAVSTFDAHGRQTGESSFDGGSTRWLYDSEEAGGALQAVELPSGGRIDYSSVESDEASGTDIVLGPATVQTRSDTQAQTVTLTWGRTPAEPSD